MDLGGDPDEDDAGVLSPDELDFEDEEDVAPLGGDRYVIGADDSPDVEADASDVDALEADAGDGEGQLDPTTDEEASPAGDAAGETGGRTVTGREVKRWLGAELDELDSDYAYHITARCGGGTAHQQVATDDVGAAFDGLLVWYVRQVAGSTPVDEALGILLGESNVQVRYPTESLAAYLDDHDLDPEDSIEDLLDAVAAEDGLVLPRQR